MARINIERLKAIIDSVGIPQSVLERQASAPERYLKDVLNGKRKNVNPDYVKVWASALGTTPAYLIGETDDPAPEQKEKPVHLDDQEILKQVRLVFGDEAEELIRLCRDASEERKDIALDILRRVYKDD